VTAAQDSEKVASTPTVPPYFGGGRLERLETLESFGVGECERFECDFFSVRHVRSSGRIAATESRLACSKVVSAEERECYKSNRVNNIARSVRETVKTVLRASLLTMYERLRCCE